MATEQNATWFDGAASEYVKEEDAAEDPNAHLYLTPFTDALPRSPEGIVQGNWFNEETGKVVYVWGSK